MLADIINEIYRSKRFADIISTAPVESRDELRSDLSFMICKMPSEKLERLWLTGQIWYYISRVCTNEQKKVFRTPLGFQINYDWQPAESSDKVSQVDRFDLLEECTPDTEGYTLFHFDAAKKYIDEVDTVENRLLRLYILHGSYRKVAKQTGVPLVAVHTIGSRAIQAVRQHLIEQGYEL